MQYLCLALAAAAGSDRYAKSPWHRLFFSLAGGGSLFLASGRPVQERDANDVEAPREWQLSVNLLAAACSSFPLPSHRSTARPLPQTEFKSTRTCTQNVQSCARAHSVSRIAIPGDCFSLCSSLLCPLSSVLLTASKMHLRGVRARHGITQHNVSSTRHSQATILIGVLLGLGLAHMRRCSLRRINLRGGRSHPTAPCCPPQRQAGQSAAVDRRPAGYRSEQEVAGAAACEGSARR